ncbi:MAG: hypothetical protein EBS05_26660 [Proteobacteria bacterium]|nr:hypothetical protein [Pseudomonadota bacterium]
METNKPTSDRQTGLRKRRIFIGLWVSSAWAAALDELVMREHADRSQLLRCAAAAKANRATAHSSDRKSEISIPDPKPQFTDLNS